jgi:hypothetical protein
MGFEDSMIENGFHDEEEYLEHLIDEADKIFEHQLNRQSSCIEEGNEDFYFQSDYNELRIEFQHWIRANPIMHKVFLVWFFFYAKRDKKNNNILLDKFEEWRDNETLQIIKLQKYYGDTYYRIIKYSRWEQDNLIEDILRRPHFKFYYPQNSNLNYNDIPPTELLTDELNNIEEWIENKEKYNQWSSAVSDEIKKQYVNNIIWNKLNAGDTAYIRECILQQLEEDEEPEYLKEEVMNWFELDCNRARELFLYIKCVQDFTSRGGCSQFRQI